ncbi:uncharacterized protein LOC121962266 [Plectropomus leopardus]|uniref:uncharacterized protein LOC121962266 n=1 Tax=Plectropomus leopardus TaxID=160734 RepID=UPI001C4BB568|nr:uncharacterized protein LOC121962266 [Plectropomus leopardus]
MRSFSLVTAFLLCNWISVSGSESQIMEVQPGEEVTLTCNNISSGPTQTEWFRLIHGTKPSCISAMYRADDEASLCDGFQNRFKMSSNISTVFLKIKRVNLSDSGLYFCGLFIGQHTVIAKAIQLNIQGNGESDGGVDSKSEKDSDGIQNPVTVIAGALMIFSMVAVIVLVAKIRQLQKAANDGLHPERNKNLGSDDLNPAALRFLPNTTRNRRPESGRQLETHVIYAASR